VHDSLVRYSLVMLRREMTAETEMSSKQQIRVCGVLKRHRGGTRTSKVTAKVSGRREKSGSDAVVVTI